MHAQQVGAKCSAEMMCIQRHHANECVAGSDPHLDTNNVTDKVAVKLILLKDYKVMFATTAIYSSFIHCYLDDKLEVKNFTHGSVKILLFLGKNFLRGFFVIVISDIRREIGSLEVRVQDGGGVQRGTEQEGLRRGSWLVRHLPLEEGEVRPGKTLRERVS